MALRTPLSVTPHLYMGDSTGRPLDMGTVYFGEQDKDPEFYPINLFSDDALTLPLAQPIHTKGGYLYDKGDMVEPHAKELIYSVKVLDSYGRKVFYKGAMMRNSWNDDVIQQISAALFSTAEEAAQIAGVAAREAIEASTVDGSLVTDALTKTVPVATGGISRNQAAKNAQYVTIEDFGGDFVAAGNWIKQSVGNYLYLQAGATYTINGTGDVYFNRILCRDGVATVVVPANIRLIYKNKTDGTEVVHLENITYKVLGHRKSASSPLDYGDDQIYPHSQATTPVLTSTLKNLDVYGLTDINDIDSWSDDAGRSRAEAFISLKILDKSEIDNIRTFGVGIFAILSAGSPKATHKESNCKFYNCETGFYLPSPEWARGESDNLTIINTPEQRKYWIRKDSGLLENGKDVIMCEADHVEHYQVSHITGEHVIERSVYLASKITKARFVTDIGCNSGFGLKSNYIARAGSVAYVSDTNSIDTTSLTNCLGIYGWNKYKGERINITYSAKTAARAIAIEYVGDVELKDVYIKNSATPFYLLGEDLINSLSISGAVLDDCGDSSQASLFSKRAGDAVILNFLQMRDVRSNDSNMLTKSYNARAIDLNGVIKAEFIGVTAACNASPIAKGSQTSYVEITDCNFTVVRNEGSAGMWSLLKTTLPTYASKFNFNIRFISTTENSITFNARFKKDNNSGLVNITDYWSEMDFTYVVSTSTAKGLVNVGDSSFELLASFKGSQLRYIYDAVTKTSTTIYNAGGVFETTSTVGKLAVYMAASGMLIVDVGQGVWSGGTGTVTVNLKRF